MRNDAGAMTFYRHMQMPGVDWLARKIGTPVTAKQVASAAHQCGRERVICETYGGSGWNISFEEMKWISEWLYVLGVNATCQHLALYSMRGQRKKRLSPVSKLSAAVVGGVFRLQRPFYAPFVSSYAR